MIMGGLVGFRKDNMKLTEFCTKYTFKGEPVRIFLHGQLLFTGTAEDVRRNTTLFSRYTVLEVTVLFTYLTIIVTE